MSSLPTSCRWFELREEILGVEARFIWHTRPIDRHAPKNGTFFNALVANGNFDEAALIDVRDVTLRRPPV
jgi:hypothetical protein